MIYTAATSYDDIADSNIIELGVGCGILTCAASMMGASHIIGIDVDHDALIQAKENIQELGVDADLIQMDVASLLSNDELLIPFQAETVIMNPPFGTKIKGIDMIFLHAASKVLFMLL